MHRGRECWQRAISLALTLMGGADQFRDEMGAKLFETFESAKEEHGQFTLGLAVLLESYTVDED